MIPNFHLNQQKGELTLPQTSQCKNAAGQKDSGWCKRKVEIKTEASGGRTLCLHLACEQALLFGRAKLAARERASERRSWEGPRPFSILPPALASPLARLSRVYFSRYPPNGELALSGSLHSVMKQLNYQSALIGATNGNRPHSTRSAHWPKYNFISNSLEQGCGRQRYPRRQRKNAGMSRVQRNSEKYSIWLSRASRNTIPLLTWWKRILNELPIAHQLSDKQLPLRQKARSFYGNKDAEITWNCSIATEARLETKDERDLPTVTDMERPS